MLKKKVRFINYYHYSFDNEKGEHIEGYKLNCYDSDSHSIIKVSCKELANWSFGDTIEVTIKIFYDKVRSSI